MDNNFNNINHSYNHMNQGNYYNNSYRSNNFLNNSYAPIGSYRNNTFLHNSIISMGNNSNNNMNSLNRKTMVNLSYSYNIRNQNQDINKNLKKDKDIEQNIRDNLKCHFCLSKVINPKMCKYCKRVSCQKCISKWMETHNYCNFCKKNLNPQDLISLPFLGDMSAYFINNIDSYPKNIQHNSSNIMNNDNKNVQNSNPNNYMNTVRQSSKVQNGDICPIHNSKIEYYCVQCDKYFCSNCLVFFREETKNHKNHLIIPASKINNLNLQEPVKEYKKLYDTKNILDNYIDLCKVKLKENQIKQAEIANFMNFIRDLYIKKIEKNSQEIKLFLNNLANLREQIENKIVSVPNGFNNIINSNDYAQGHIVSEDLKKINRIDPNIEYYIKEQSKVNPKLFLNNYESDYLQFSLPFSGQYYEGQEVFKKSLNIIPGFPSTIFLQYLQNKIVISYSVDISLSLNDPRYPKFFIYVIFKKGKDGLEFMNLSNQSFPQDFYIQGNNHRQIAQQVNSFSYDATQFINLGGNDKIIKMKIYIIKYHYE